MNKNFSSKLKILAALNICWLSIANGQPAVGPATEDADFWLMMIPLIVKSASANQVPAPTTPLPAATPAKRPYIKLNPPGAANLPPVPQPVFPDCTQGCVSL